MSTFVFRSGKHKGKSLQLVRKIDPDYVDWVRENHPEMLEEPEPIYEEREKKERIEPPEDSEVPKTALQNNTNFLNEGPNGKNENT